jgi:hypothetical protein
LSPSSVSCTLFKIGSVFEKIKHRIECVFWFWKTFAWIFFYFKKNWRDIRINVSMLYIKYVICLKDFKGKWFFYRMLRNIQILNFLQFEDWNPCWC